MMSLRSFDPQHSSEVHSTSYVGVVVSQRTHARIPSAVLNLDRLDDRLHRGGHDLGVRMSDNDIAVALVAVAARRAGLGQPGLDDEAAAPLLCAIDAGHPQ